MASASELLRHTPVLLEEVMAALKPRDGEIYVDGTFGAGGYSRAMLEAADCQVYALDRDPAAVAGSRGLVNEFSGRLTVIEGRFSDVEVLLAEHGVTRVDGIALDIGVSSMQLDQAERGFSFQQDGPLDMRMSSAGESAADVVNNHDEADLTRILQRLGEEPRARRIAAAIVKARAEKPITRTSELANIVASAIGFYRKKGARAKHPATRTFQALRIYVNDELGELARGLAAAERTLKPEGRLCVVCFHSLEDKIVKAFMIERSGSLPGPSRHLPVAANDSGSGKNAPTFEIRRKRADKPSEDEIGRNPRARSARLRAAVRTSADPWPSPTEESRS